MSSNEAMSSNKVMSSNEAMSEESFENTLIIATVVAVVLILILTIVIVVCIIRKTPSKPNQEGGRSNSLKNRMKDIYHKYWSVQDSNAPQGITRDRPNNAPMETQGSINNEKTAKEKADEGNFYST